MEVETRNAPANPADDAQQIRRARRMSWLVFWGLVCLAAISAVAASAQPGTREYAKAHSSLFALLLIITVVYLIRVRAQGTSPLPRRFWILREWIDYYRSGALAADAMFLIAALIALLVLDLSFWRTYTIKIGAVASVVLVRLIFALFRRA